MAMIQCPECGRAISDKAEACPGCGCPVQPRSQDNFATRNRGCGDILVGGCGAAMIIALVFLLLLLMLLFF